ncbi:hypothetical protein I3760_05G037900 [Carya illinoinensis]|nr:hypothetical protein I3760_05G037900 [Carya illinoinensis]
MKNNGSTTRTPRESLHCFCCLLKNIPSLSALPAATSFTQSISYSLCAGQRSCSAVEPLLEAPCILSPSSFSLEHRLNVFGFHTLGIWIPARYMSNASPADNAFSRTEGKKKNKRIKISKRAKLNELRFYHLKAKKKMTSPNPEVRIRYKLEKAKRKEAWLIEMLRKFEVPKAPAETYDPEILTEEERHYFKRTVGRRGVFGGVVLNMHLHWKRHETVKLARLSKGIVIDIKANDVILFYRGKSYVQPKVMSPPDTLSKDNYEQSLEHTSQFIEKLEEELEEYQKHLARYKKAKEDKPKDSVIDT